MFGKEEKYKIDYLLIITIIVIFIIGVLTIFSAGFDPVEKVNNGLYKKQLFWFFIGFVIMIAVSFINYKLIGDYSIHIFLISLFLLIITTMFGTPIRNTRAWINLGFFSIQPSEFMKLSLVIILGKYLELKERDIKYFRELLIPSILTLIPVLIIFLQPDFGTAMIFIPIFFTMLFVGGADVSHLLSIISIAAIALIMPMILTYREWVGVNSSSLVLDFFKEFDLLLLVSGTLLVVAITSYILNFFFVRKYYRKIYIPSIVLSLGLFFSIIIQKYLKEYQKKRILVFLNPNLDPHGSGYNIIQSKIAVGSGGITGKGFLKGSQSQLGFLPEKSSDFIFSVVSEEWGFIGALVLMTLLIIVVFRGFQIALETRDKYGALLASGISSIFFFHIFINIGMAVGIMPVTGLPLCFVSYGGSNLIMAMIAIGILINIRMKKFVN